MHCTCPAAEYQPVCKHIIALALTVSDTDISVGNKRSVNLDREAIQAYLSELEPQSVIEMLLDYLSRDERQWNQLLTKVHFANHRPAYRELKSLVTQALPRCDLENWREVGPYFMEAEIQLKLIFDSLDTSDVHQQWKLINYIVERLNSVLERIDDSNGDRFGLETLINEKMPQIFQRLEWSDAEKAQWMFERLTSFEFDVFPSIEKDFIASWNNDFLNLCREAIEQPFAGQERWKQSQYVRPLIISAKDWREVANIKQKVAHSSRDYLELCRLFMEHDEFDETECWLNKAQRIAAPHDQQECCKVQVTLLLKQGEIDSAWTLANTQFQKLPTFDEYQTLVVMKDKYRIDDALFFERVECIFIDIHKASLSPFMVGQDDIVLFYLSLNEQEKACCWVDDHPTHYKTLMMLTDVIFQNRPDKAVKYTIRSVSDIIDQTNNQSYKYAIQLLQALETKLSDDHENLACFYQSIKQLAHTYKRKRNMLALFKMHYSVYV